MNPSPADKFIARHENYILITFRVVRAYTEWRVSGSRSVEDLNRCFIGPAAELDPETLESCDVVRGFAFSDQ